MTKIGELMDCKGKDCKAQIVKRARAHKYCDDCAVKIKGQQIKAAVPKMLQQRMRTKLARIMDAKLGTNWLEK